VPLILQHPKASIGPYSHPQQSLHLKSTAIQQADTAADKGVGRHVRDKGAGMVQACTGLQPWMRPYWDVRHEGAG